MPAGSVSVNATPLRLTDAFGFEIENPSADVSPTVIKFGVNDDVIWGGLAGAAASAVAGATIASAARLAVSARPLSPIVDFTPFPFSAPEATVPFRT
jgi:hypothetical protein